jgi:methionyl-tRNA synthetase
LGNAGSVKLLSVGYSLRPPELLFRKIEDAEITNQVEKLKSKSKQTENLPQEKRSELTVDSSQLTAGNQQQAVLQSKNDSALVNIPNQQPTINDQLSSIKPEIQYDSFEKLDLRIGTITAAEKVAKADKLLKLQIDLGFEQRTIVSGIAQHFTPESLVNKQVIVVANLAPRKMRGIESQGMILTAEQNDGKLILVNPDALTSNGATVK